MGGDEVDKWAMTKWKYSRKEIAQLLIAYRTMNLSYTSISNEVVKDLLAKAPTKQGKKVKEIKRLELSHVNLGTPGLALIDYGDKINELVDAVNCLTKNK